MSQPIKVFISYSRKDKEYKEELLEFLAPMRRNNVIQIWNDKDIVPGEQWEDELLERLTTADIVIFLVSPSLLNSDYIHRVEIKGAMERHKKGELVIIPILIRNSDFAESDFKTFQGLPADLKPVTTWDDRDSAWLSVTKGLKRVIESIQKKIEAKKATPSTQNNSTIPPSNPNTNTGDSLAASISSLNEVRSLIGSGKTKKAIELLSQYIESNNLKNERNDLILQSGKLSNIQQDQLRGIKSSSEIGIEMSRINYALLSMITDLEKEVK